MKKADRQNALVKIVQREPIGSQSELAARLTAAGFSVTQASVSRDLDELGIAKADGIYTAPRRFTADLGEVIFDTAGDSLIVGRCASGLASAVTVRIDRASISGVVGTVAGDDTIFIAVKTQDMQPAVLQELEGLF